MARRKSTNQSLREYAASREPKSTSLNLPSTRSARQTASSLLTPVSKHPAPPASRVSAAILLQQAALAKWLALQVARFVRDRIRQPGSIPEIEQVLPLLLGVGMGWQWRGAARLVAPALEPSASAPYLLGCVLLLTLAVGPHIPDWLLVPVTSWLRGREQGVGRAGAAAIRRNTGASSGKQEAPDSFRRLALAVLCGTTGIISLLQVALASPFLKLFESIMRSFFWTELTVTLLQGVWATVLLGAGWCAHGMILVVLGRLRSGTGTVEPGVRSVTGEALIGVAIGSIVGSALLDRHLAGQQLYLMGVLPLFVMAMLCVRSSRVILTSTDKSLTVKPPEISPADEWLGVGAWMATALAAALCIEGLCGCRLLLAPERRADLGWILLVMGASFLVTSGWRKAGTCLSDAGHLLWVAGLVVSAGLWMRAGASEYVLIGLAAAGLGGSLGVLEHDILARMSGERASFALIATAGLAGAAAGLAVGHWWACPLLGPCGVLVLSILLLLATAGFLQIYTQDAPTHVRCARLGLVFALLAASMLGVPPEARRWAQREQAARASDWPDFGIDSSLAQMAARAGSVCWIAPRPPESFGHPNGVRLQFMPTFGGGFQAEPAISGGFWAAQHRHYDLIYQCWPDRAERFPQYAQDWLRRLFAAAAPAGTVCVDVPVAQLGQEAQRVILATFARAAGDASVHHGIAAGPHGECLRLQGSFGVAIDPGTGVTRTRSEDYDPVGPVHSLRRDRLTSSREASPTPSDPMNATLTARRH